ncbi:hypothetical protein M426DRAFT_16810 [Hypoxylon sp. CI-4A]|nr:hypothetical protein M426DRAFT_16810 [Hypoxylon sp. CI-4A]
MASTSLRAPAFNLTKDEKKEHESHINSLLGRCANLLESHEKHPSALALDEASCEVEDAIFMAEDPGICEFPPLAKCYLYKGRVLGAMGRYAEAHISYQTATLVPLHTSADRAAARNAAILVTEMEVKIRDEKRKGVIWHGASQSPPAGVAQLQKVNYHEMHPRIQEVTVQKAVLVKQRELRVIPRRQKLVKCDGGWTAETQSVPDYEDGMLRGMRHLVPPSPGRHLSFREHLALRTL